ncbi:MAG TPA: hybrid sensor histidine kinase/response regulator [Aggregatilineales bacterium]|nr:hybrid sensor histidine kinase/response regulator [Aggregatilineales bacterium]
MERILVIDDNQPLRELVAGCLKDDYSVVTAIDGFEGLQMAQNCCPDLVICDVNMPVMNGFEVYERFQQSEALRDAVFIFLSGSSDSSAVRHGMTLGADDFLLKPFEIDELIEVVKRRLGKRAQQRAALNQEIDTLRLNITKALPHELRTSIMIMEGYANLIIDDPGDQDVIHREMVKSIAKGAERLRYMAEKYLWYLRSLLPEKIDPNATTLAPNHTIYHCMNEAANRFGRSADASLESSDVPLAIDPEFFNEIVEEIVENAFKFSKAGTPVTVTGEQVNYHYRITVVNLGREMTPEQIQHIGAFMQFDRSQQEQQGTGLGLIIVKRLVELHGGQFQIESQAGKTTVTVTLPVKSSALQVGE